MVEALCVLAMTTSIVLISVFIASLVYWVDHDFSMTWARKAGCQLAKQRNWAGVGSVISLALFTGGRRMFEWDTILGWAQTGAQQLEMGLCAILLFVIAAMHQKLKKSALIQEAQKKTIQNERIRTKSTKASFLLRLNMAKEAGVQFTFPTILSSKLYSQIGIQQHILGDERDVEEYINECISMT